MNPNKSRREAIAALGAGAALLATTPISASALESTQTKNTMLKGNINHSVCRWCYGDIEFDAFCKAAAQMGIKSVELTGPDEWPVLKKYGLTCAMPWGAGMGIEKGTPNTYPK
jgi:hydroxypyruvate isomerase